MHSIAIGSNCFSVTHEHNEGTTTYFVRFPKSYDANLWATDEEISADLQKVVDQCEINFEPHREEFLTVERLDYVEFQDIAV